MDFLLTIFVITVCMITTLAWFRISTTTKSPWFVKETHSAFFIMSALIVEVLISLVVYYTLFDIMFSFIF